MVNQSHTAVVARGEHWQGEAASEPYEAAWAREAIFFLRLLKRDGDLGGTMGRVQISADGLHWADEGTTLAFPGEIGAVAFCRVAHFGGFLRLAATIPEAASCQVVLSLVLKE